MAKRAAQKAEYHPFQWVQHAHRIYVSARYLFFNGLIYEGAWLGTYAVEMYLKAYLIYKRGQYERPPYKAGYYVGKHTLKEFYRDCMEFDDFFKQEWLAECFLPEKAQKPNAPQIWENYRDLIYPEPLKNRGKKGSGISYRRNSAGTFESLDCIARFMYDNIPPPPKPVILKNFTQGKVKITKTSGSVIDDLLNGNGYIHGLGFPKNSSEIIDVFLRRNRYFLSMGKDNQQRGVGAKTHAPSRG